MKKLLLLLFYLIAFSVLSYPQDRVSTPKPVLSDKALGSISYALGCYYDKRVSEWREADNSIYVIDNFIKFEFRGLTYKGQNYLVLIKYMKEGTYRYPHIQEGYYEYTKTPFYILDVNDYENQLKNIGNSNKGLIECGVVAKGDGISGIDALLTDIQYVLNRESNADKKTKLYIQYKNDAKKDISRFLIYDETCSVFGGSEFCDYGGFKAPALIYKNEDWYSNLKKETMFNFVYYEVDSFLFDKFINSPMR